MKPLLRFALPLFCLIIFLGLTPNASAEDVAINKTNFPDDIFRSYLSDVYDRDSDGALSETEISEITSLHVPSMGIASLKGIKYFSELKHINCPNNQLTSLDLSSNTALRTLNCTKNQLTSLDLSSNVALSMLNCDYNQLTSLDLRNNTALFFFDCSYNQLTRLDLSNNTALTQFLCFSNQLSILDVRNNTALTHLSCGHNQLSNLNVRNNTALTHLSCGHNQLSNLNVSKNTALTSLSCGYNKLSNLDVSKNTALTVLECCNNQITYLDVSLCNRLRNLACYSNHLINLDISNCPKLVILVNISEPYIDARGIRYGGSAKGWSESDTVLLYDKDTTLITPTPDLILPSSLKTISEEAFAGGAFRYVKLSEQTESIGLFAFADCPNLKYIYIPNDTATIDDNAFGDIQELVIFGKAGSTADDYAYDHYFDFIPIS